MTDNQPTVGFEPGNGVEMRQMIAQLLAEG